MKEYFLNLDITVLKAAFAHALPKETYVASHVCDAILANWELLSEDDKEYFVNAINQSKSISKFELENWQKIIKKHQTELEQQPGDDYNKV